MLDVVMLQKCRSKALFMLTNIVGNIMGHIEERPGKVYGIFGKFDCKWRPLKKMLKGIINISLGIRHLCFIL